MSDIRSKTALEVLRLRLKFNGLNLNISLVVFRLKRTVKFSRHGPLKMGAGVNGDTNRLGFARIGCFVCVAWSAVNESGIGPKMRQKSSH